MKTETALRSDHPMMAAWNKFCDTDEFKNALRWATATEYDDGRHIDPVQQEKHAKGAMWLAFTKSYAVAADLAPDPSVIDVKRIDELLALMGRNRTLDNTPDYHDIKVALLELKRLHEVSQ